MDRNNDPRKDQDQRADDNLEETVEQAKEVLHKVGKGVGKGVQRGYDQTKDVLGKSSFFKFDRMITPSLIRFIFIVGLIVNTILALSIFGFAMDSYYGGGLYILLGIIVLVIGPFLIRIWCERMIVIFKIHENLEELRRQGRL